MKAVTKHPGTKQKAGTPKKLADTYQLKVTLDGIEPPIWRRLEVPGDINLGKLHEAIQVAMGWTNSHLHQFIVGETFYGVPDAEFDDRGVLHDEREYTLAGIAKKTGSKFTYQYDFGDSWDHLIVVEGIRTSKTPVLPTCLAGERHCPPEDVGSVSGYEKFLQAIKDPKHPEHEDLLEWAGSNFDPEAFDMGITNQDLKELCMAGSLEALWPGQER